VGLCFPDIRFIFFHHFNLFSCEGSLVCPPWERQWGLSSYRKMGLACLSLSLFCGTADMSCQGAQQTAGCGKMLLELLPDSARLSLRE
jgi:hypothetical protein